MKSTTQLWEERQARERSTARVVVLGFIAVCSIALIVFASVW